MEYVDNQLSKVLSNPEEHSNTLLLSKEVIALKTQQFAQQNSLHLLQAQNNALQLRNSIFEELKLTSRQTTAPSTSNQTKEFEKAQKLLQRQKENIELQNKVSSLLRENVTLKDQNSSYENQLSESNKAEISSLSSSKYQEQVQHLQNQLQEARKQF